MKGKEKNDLTYSDEQRESIENFPNESATTHKYKNSLPKDFENILKELEIYHVMSFSSSISSVKKENKKPLFVESEIYIPEQNKIISKNENLALQLLNLKEKIQSSNLSNIVDKKVEEMNMRLMGIDEKINQIKEINQINENDTFKYKFSEKGETVEKSRKPGFTSQFSSCRSFENDKSPLASKEISKERYEEKNKIENESTSRILSVSYTHLTLPTICSV